VLAGLTLAATLATGSASPAAAHSEIRVPEDVATLEQAIARAQPGDTIALAAGTYPGGNVVPPASTTSRSGAPIATGSSSRGQPSRPRDRRPRRRCLDPQSLRPRLRLNGLYWEDADRYRASYVTVWNVGGYGIYAEDGERGVIDHMYASGAADAAYYIGECKPCRATIAHVVARLSAVGYSGTNSTGVVIRDSLWDRNGVGLLPNTYANEALAPQARTTILRNTVTNSGLAGVPIRTPTRRLHRYRDRGRGRQ
jgi:hypothetical protein